MNEFYYISHGGPGSGRYPWGSGDRPYQRLEGSRSRSGGISGYIKSRKAKKIEEKKMKQFKDQVDKRLEDEKKRKEKEANKEKVLSSGTAKDVLAYKGELTNAELQRAYQRLDYERRLSEFSQSEIKTNMQKIDKAMQNLKTVNNWGSIATDSYNLLASVYNVTEEGKKNPWTMIQKGGGGSGDKKKK